VENERLLWELEQMRGMADVNEVTRLRAEIDGLRQEMLHMANRYESLEVIKAAAMKLMAFLYTHTHIPFCICLAQCGCRVAALAASCHVSWKLTSNTPCTPNSSKDMLGLHSGTCA